MTSLYGIKALVPCPIFGAIGDQVWMKTNWVTKHWNWFVFYLWLSKLLAIPEWRLYICKFFSHCTGTCSTIQRNVPRWLVYPENICCHRLIFYFCCWHQLAPLWFLRSKYFVYIMILSWPQGWKFIVFLSKQNGMAQFSINVLRCYQTWWV